MATSGDMTLIAHYSGKRLSLTIPTNAKVGDVVQKAAETLHLKKADLPLSLLYQGVPVDDGVLVEVNTASVDTRAREALLCLRLEPNALGICVVNKLECVLRMPCCRLLLFVAVCVFRMRCRS